MQWLASVLGAGLLAIAVSPTKSTAADNVVRWASNREVEIFDPHATDELQAQGVHAYLYEPLVAYDWQWRLEPALAESCRVVDPTTWEFEHRAGVAFHDGTAYQRRRGLQHRARHGRGLGVSAAVVQRRSRRIRR
jgi:peptide/nickel transport system substrate-binding protein